MDARFIGGYTWIHPTALFNSTPMTIVQIEFETRAPNNSTRALQGTLESLVLGHTVHP